MLQYVHYEIDYPAESTTEAAKRELALSKKSMDAFMSGDGEFCMYPPQVSDLDISMYLPQVNDLEINMYPI